MASKPLRKQSHYKQSATGTRASATDLQRRRILGAALHAFASTGYLGTKISDIAAEAGVSHGLVHHYYGSKILLYSTILEAGLSYLEESRRRALAGKHSLEEQQRRWVYSVIHCFDHKDTVLFGRLVMQILGAPDVHPPACVEALNRFTKLEIQILCSLLMDAGKSLEEATSVSCLVFNTILGNKLIGMHQDAFNILFRTGCDLLGVSDQPLPEPIDYPSFPWTLE